MKPIANDQIYKNRYRAIALLKSGYPIRPKYFMMFMDFSMTLCGCGIGIITMALGYKSQKYKPDIYSVVASDLGIPVPVAYEIEYMFENLKHSFSEIADFLIKEHGFPNVESDEVEIISGAQLAIPAETAQVDIQPKAAVE